MAIDVRQVRDVELERHESVVEYRVIEQAAGSGQRFEHQQPVLGQLGAAQEDALETQQGLGHGPAAVQFPDQVGVVRAHSIEEHLAELFGPGDVANRANLQTGRVDVEQQEADALLLLGVRVGAHQGEHVGGIVRQRGPDLLAGDDEVIAVTHGARAQAGQVRA